MPTLSVVMIVRNEAHCLGECLASIASIADEIVIADTGSTDSTCDIARQFGAHLFSIEWRNDFAWARNQTLWAAKGDWLLHLDADEVLDPENARKLRAVVDEGGRDSDAVELYLANYCDDPRAWRWEACAPNDPWSRGHAGLIRVGLLRLFRNHMGFEYREPVHESISESVRERGGRLRCEDILIHHYGYAGDATRGEAKARLYLDIARAKAEQRPNDPKAWRDVAEQALSFGLEDEAEHACRTALTLDPLYLDCATTLANLLLNRAELTEGRALLERLVDAGITPPHVPTALAAINCREGRFSEALTLLDAVLAVYPRALMARLYAARALDCLGRYDEARTHLLAAVDIAPSLSEPRNRLEAHRLRSEAIGLLGAADPTQPLKRLVEAMTLDPEDACVHHVLGVLLKGLGQSAKADESFCRAQTLAPGLVYARE
jgi:tetratricopeptide (TPR) repeat protein